MLRVAAVQEIRGPILATEFHARNPGTNFGDRIPIAMVEVGSSPGNAERVMEQTIFFGNVPSVVASLVVTKDTADETRNAQSTNYD